MSEMLIYLMFAGAVVLNNEIPVTFNKMTTCVQTARILNNHHKTDKFYCQTSAPIKGSDL